MSLRVILALSVASREHTLPSLDGLRAVSIALVLFAHSADTPHGYSLRLLNYLGEVGVFGVKIFFVISGFLITTLLLREREKTGQISLKRFYIRRVLRIFPAFYTFLLITLLLARCGFVEASRSDFLHAATFTANLTGMGWVLLHIWSLSVEEQFYLLWPLSLVLLGTRLPMRVAGALILIPPLLSGFVLHGHLRFGEAISGLAAGCVLAAIRRTRQTDGTYLRLLSRAGTAWLIMISLFLLESLHRFWFYELFAPVISLGIALLIDTVLTFPQGSSLGRFLNLRAVAYFGTLSYSIYLWQQLFLNRWGHAWFNAFPINVLCAIGCALCSFYFVERPFLRLKNRFEPRRQTLVEPIAC